MSLQSSKDETENSEVVLSLQGISKKYGQNLALKPMDFELYRGEVHVLFGENGAGKSTLISMIAGANKPTSGSIKHNHIECQFSSVKEARNLGICAVFQEFSLVPQLSVADNMFLGAELTKGVVLDKKAMNDKATEILTELDFELDATQIVGNLPRAGQQMVEIAKAFCANVSVLILDEPTASLTDHETEKLFLLVEKLKKNGVGIIYITHRMAEIRQISDRVSVLRDGTLVGQLLTKELNEDSLVEMMTGESASEIFPCIKSEAGDVLFKVDGLTSSHGVDDVSITVRQGEVVGLAGLIGSGKSELAEVCYGLAPKDKGSIEVSGKLIDKPTPKALIDAGLYYCPPDRRETGLVLDGSVGNNLTLNALKTEPLSHEVSYVLKRKNERFQISSLIKKLTIKVTNDSQLVKDLSGGNQQKILIAKALSRKFNVFIFDEPTVGVDIATRKVIYQFIADLCKNGSAVLLISSDLPEIIHLTHRAYVFYHGKIAAQLEGEEITEQKVLSHFFGKNNKHDTAALNETSNTCA